MKIFKIVAVLLLILFLFLELFFFRSSTNEMQSKPLVAVSTFSLYGITKHIAQESVELVNILPFGVDPHSFELTPRTVAKIERSVLVLYSGAGLEPWVEKISFTTQPVDMSTHVSLRKLEHDEEDDAHEHHNEHCEHGVFDPHYWLDFENMQKMAQVVTQKLITLLPQNKTMYEKNRDRYIQMLERLDRAYKMQLTSCELDDVILNHSSLGYLADKYNFRVDSLSGLSPEAQSTASDIKRVLKEIKEKKITTIFYESFINSKIIESISQESDAEIAVIQPLGNITADEADQNATYESLMLQNLQKLKKAMLCH